MTSSPLTLWTIGHSTRPIDEFIALLKAHRIENLVDVRTVPRSRHNPQFNSDVLARSLAGIGVSYQHTARLGGLRKPKKDSLNQGWRNESFRGYADYMRSGEFWEALEKLMADCRSRPTAMMCAEAMPWRCHRSLIADALVSRCCEVRHIMTDIKADRHRMTSFARVEREYITYPKPSEEQMPGLFG
jgi:uncharacterized protein (DUF488 family)